MCQSLLLRGRGFYRLCHISTAVEWTRDDWPMGMGGLVAIQSIYSVVRAASRRFFAKRDSRHDGQGELFDVFGD